jgi:hypothetical protein
MDKAGASITVDALTQEALLTAPGSTTNRICGPRSNGSEPAIAQPHQTGSPDRQHAQTPRCCCGGWSPRPNASGGWKQRTGSSERRSL